MLGTLGDAGPLGFGNEIRPSEPVLAGQMSCCPPLRLAHDGCGERSLLHDRFTAEGLVRKVAAGAAQGAQPWFRLAPPNAHADVNPDAGATLTMLPQLLAVIAKHNVGRKDTLSYQRKQDMLPRLATNRD